MYAFCILISKITFWSLFSLGANLQKIENGTRFSKFRGAIKSNCAVPPWFITFYRVLRIPWLSVISSHACPKNFLVPLLHKSWDNWNRFYNEIMRNARIIKESGILNYRKIANGGFIKK